MILCLFVYFLKRVLIFYLRLKKNIWGADGRINETRLSMLQSLKLGIDYPILSAFVYV